MFYEFKIRAFYEEACFELHQLKDLKEDKIELLSHYDRVMHTLDCPDMTSYQYHTHG